MIKLDELSEWPSSKKAAFALGGIFVMSWVIIICGIVFSNLPIENSTIGAGVGTGAFISIVVPTIIGYFWILLTKLYN